VDAHEVADRRVNRGPKDPTWHVYRERRSCHVPAVFALEAVLEELGHDRLNLRQFEQLVSVGLRILAPQR
jgi:hypothetical protein